MLDLAAALRSDGALTVSAVNKSDASSREVSFVLPEGYASAAVYTLNGPSKDSYNDVDATPVTICENDCVLRDGAALVTLPPHSVNLIVLR